MLRGMPDPAVAVAPDEDPTLDALLGPQGSARHARGVARVAASRSGSCGRSATTPAPSSTSSSATATPRSCGSSASRRACAATSRCSRRSRRCATTASFEVYAGVCETGEPLVDEITFDTPFAEGYARGTILRRTAKLGDGLIVLLDDVTEQRRTEAELRGYADAVAHDLSEPIAAHGGPRDPARAPPRRAGPTPRCCGSCATSVGRARQLVDGVLEYARAGQVRRDRVDLGALMGEVEQDLRARLAEAEATVEVRDLPEVSGDARLLRRVLQNLVGNAAKFRGDAPAHITVEAREQDGDWVVSVRDRGVGVPPADADRIFGMFARSGDDAAGNGIGLAVSRRVVEAHGGRIWVEPAEGGGSAFRFTLPR